MNADDLKKISAAQDWTDIKGDSYFPSESLVQAARVAARLNRPLLLMGEPGCGKTMFASAIARLLGWKFREWNVKSTQTAQEALYTYDMVGRLRDSQLLANNAIADEAERAELARRTIGDYVQMGELGDALTSDHNTVLLIDEIDKADRDFPNDLLLELDRQHFYVEELKTWRGHPEKDDPDKSYDIVSETDLMVIITSNNERELPEPFLRRCVFFYIEFPDEDILQRILNSHLNRPHSDELLERIIQRFQRLRNEMVTDLRNGEQVKPPSTSELIDWVKILRDENESELLESLDDRIPYSEVLVKRWEDHLKYIKNA